jgi:hypothetical protein
MSGQPFTAQPASGQPYPGQPYPGQSFSDQPFVGQPFVGQPVSGQPFSGPPVSGPTGAGTERPPGTLYQTGQFPTVTPPPQQPPPRYLPPPLAAPGSPPGPAPQSRVIPVYAAVRPQSPAVPVVVPAQGGGGRKDRGGWLNALLVVVALLALAGAGTTIYIVQLNNDNPSTAGPSPTAGAATQGASDAGGAVDAASTGAADADSVAATTKAATTGGHTETLTMPPLTGLYVDYAKQKLRDNGFTGSIKTTQWPTDDPDQVGKVVSQDPQAQKQVAKNATITLKVGAQPSASATASPTCRAGWRVVNGVCVAPSPTSGG